MGTLLIMRTPDLPPRMISLNHDHHSGPIPKIKEEECSQRAGSVVRSGSGSGRCRSRKLKNGVKKQPQRGLGVAQLEKLRLQEEQTFVGSNIHFSNANILPASSSFVGFTDQEGFVQLQRGNPAPKVLGEGTAGLLNSNVIWPTNPMTVTHMASNHCADYNLDSSCYVSHNSHTLKSPILLGSHAISDSNSEMKSYTKAFKASRNSYNSMASTNRLPSTVEDLEVPSFYRARSGSNKSADVIMSFVNLTNPEEPLVGSAHVDSRSQLLQLYMDGSQASVGTGNSSKELSSFQTCHADALPKIAGRKRLWDIATHEEIVNPSAALALGLSLNGPHSTPTTHPEGAPFGSGEGKSSSKVVAASTNGHTMLCSSDDKCLAGDFLGLHLASSTDGHGSVHELVEECGVQKPVKESPDRLSKSSFHHEYALNNSHAHANLPNCQILQEFKMAEGRRLLSLTSEESTPTKELLSDGPTVCCGNQEVQLLAGTALFTMITAKSSASNFSFLNVMTHRLQHDDGNNGSQIFSPSADSHELNLSLELSL